MAGRRNRVYITSGAVKVFVEEERGGKHSYLFIAKIDIGAYKI